MDDFSGLLGLKPQGKSAPMAPSSSSPARNKSDSSPLFDDLSGGDDLLFSDSRSQTKPSDFDYDAMFKDPKPVYDKPVYDEEDVFESLKTPSGGSQSARFDDLFSSHSVHRKNNSSPFDDLIGNLSKPESEKRDEKGSSAFDDLIPGFGRASSPPAKRPTSETSHPQKPPYRTSSNLAEDPFVVLESASTPREPPPSGGYTDPLDDIGLFNSRKTDHSFADIDPLDSLGKSGPDVSSRDKSHLRPGNGSGSQSPVESSHTGSYHGKKVSFDEVLEPQSTSVPHATAPPYENKSLNSDGSFDLSDDVWLTVSEIPLFTLPTSAPPPSRPPPPRPTRPMKKKANEPHSHVRTSARASVNSPTAASQMDDLDDFSMGKNHTAANGEDSDGYSTAVASAAAMKDAMDKAEAKFRQAKERREKDNLKASRSMEGDPVDNYDSRERELREKQVRLDRERAEREAEMEKAQEREREERERKRVEKERERLLARQAVERATREARERAASEAHAKAQRAAVGKANTDARERAERAAVQRAHAEARERAAAGAREKAERAAAEARERELSVAREKEAKVKAERAAVERAAAEARARATAEARARVAAQAKAKQQENNNDLDSFFDSVSRPSSAPRQRTNPLDPFQDTWNKGGSFESSRASSRVPSGAAENLRKTSSATNIVDDLSSIFGASATQSGGFQDVEGETEERRRARLERHQRTQERAAQALAEKNDRDLRAQREQAEKNRIGETLDVEIKRWGAGKEGNLRALLSTLQYVLWPECGWQPVSLTDLITAASVKKFYRKATLCIHPDKVQQKGANLQQKYIAEKVFDMLKEAWNKFNSEELF